MNEISIFLNGETKHLLAKSVNELLLQEGIDPTARGIAVAINDIIALKEHVPLGIMREIHRWGAHLLSLIHI